MPPTGIVINGTETRHDFKSPNFDRTDSGHGGFHPQGDDESDEYAEVRRITR